MNGLGSCLDRVPRQPTLRTHLEWSHDLSRCYCRQPDTITIYYFTTRRRHSHFAPTHGITTACVHTYHLYPSCCKPLSLLVNHLTGGFKSHGLRFGLKTAF